MSDWVKVLGGVAIGYVAARYLLPSIGLGGAKGGGSAPAGEASRPPISRIANDTLYACEQLRPTLVQLRNVTEDRELSAGDIWLMYQQINRLT